jgi:uncharacterized protein (TIGR02246 family)
MIDRDAVRRWIDGYLHAWTTNDPEDIAAVFTDDARYWTLPTRPPIEGRDAIVRDWLDPDRSDRPDDWTARLEVIAVDGDVAIVQGEVDYTSGDDFANLWVIKFAKDGRAAEFTEWWITR